MINLEQIKKHYPENLQFFEKNILREYLQHKILEIIFNSKQGNKLSFLGGTALRIIHGNSRFSEDLDFDNFNLEKEDFLILTTQIKNELEKQGYKIELRHTFKGAYRCYIKFLEILFNNNLSKLKKEKIIIQIDTVPHNFKYTPEKKIINKFDVFTQILVTPLNILLSQKIYALLNRKRVKGRDIFDIMFLLQDTRPDYNYLKTKIGIDNSEKLKQKLIYFIDQINLEKIANDVKPFLFNSSDYKKIILFKQYIKQIEL